MEKVAIVTGASRGIGAAIAKALAQQYAVVVNYRTSRHEAEAVVNEITQIGGTALAIQADVSNESDIVALFEKTEASLGSVAALINNAGINGGSNSVEEITVNQLDTVFHTNVYGTFIACREAIKHMKKNNIKGSIVNISSEAAKFGGTRLALYAAAKAAVNTFTIACAREIAEFGIRINAVSPGVIDTGIHSDPERTEKLLASLPMKRMGEPEEVAELVSWLLSDKASYISGAVLPVTGAR